HLPAEGRVDIRSLPRDRYDFDSVSRSVTARRSGEAYRLGDKVRARVANVDLDRRELDLIILRHQTRSFEKPRRIPSDRENLTGKSSSTRREVRKSSSSYLSARDSGGRRQSKRGSNGQKKKSVGKRRRGR
ncbi:MAG: hypothetical protein VX757_11875, partial [Planctomycetota bacterium]|nr:hypothetical protein [Planctomycetota bacterium]